MDNSINNTNLLDFNRVKEILIADENNHRNGIERNQYHISLSFPYLPSNGCNWSHVLKYLKYTERNSSPEESSDFQDYNDTSCEENIYYNFECMLQSNHLNSEEIKFEFTTLSQPWYDLMVQKVL